MFKQIVFALSLVCAIVTVNAQVLTTMPAMPVDNDSITITYDASQGNGDLNGISPIYAYTGVVTDQSANMSDWKYIKSGFMVDDPSLLMTDLGNDLHQIKFHVRDFYGVPQNEQIQQIAILFKNAGASIVGRDFGGGDLFINVTTVAPNDPPVGTQNGVNITSTSSVILQLYAPLKSSVSVIGDFNNWAIQSNPMWDMTRGSGDRFWLEITGLDPNTEYAYQYVVDGDTVADPFCEKVLVETTDESIPSLTYPNLKPFPTQAQGTVSVFQTAATEYVWQNSTFQKPLKDDLVVYELLIRDFLLRKSYTTLIDSLDYLENLGINCIQLMPIMEFEENNSWGYNPVFFLAPDKFYGPKNELKRFVDECHGRGIAVTLDIALNHTYSQNPITQLWWDDVNDKPAANSPYLNPDPRHDFNVGFDFNHESQATKDLVDRVVTHWVNEYKIDGYRYDLTKGFTQVNSVGNIGLWGSYDASRIGLLKRMADVQWSADPESYVILEHFADNFEEVELSNYGMMLWGNASESYGQVAMGFQQDSDFGYPVSYQARGWGDPHLIGYMESHDEERLVYKNEEFGNGNANHDTKELATALQRVGMASALFYTVPGPKMLWQFGELGYDFSINFQCRTCPKPIVWTYYENRDRLLLYKTTKALIELKTDYPAFRSRNYTIDAGGLGKIVRINDNRMNVVVAANIDINDLTFSPTFQNTGWWYDYLTSDSTNITDVNVAINFAPGEFHIWTSKKLPKPDLDTTSLASSIINLSAANDELVTYPNPFNNSITIQLNGNEESILRLFDLSGRMLAKENVGVNTRNYTWELDDTISEGIYLLQVEQNGNIYRSKVVKQATD